MTGYKLDKLTVLTENNAIGNVVTAGFWESDVIAVLLAADPQKLIMFEPDNALYGAASAQYADNLNVEVRNATLANNTGQADYFVFTPNRFSSLLKPKKLLKVYRKNNSDNIVSINVSTVKSVCEQEKILPCAGNILLLGVNCPSTILSDAAQTDYLSYFDVIVVRQPKQGLYETEQQQGMSSIVLQEEQFTCVQEIAGDAMYTQFVYVRDHQSEKISALQAKVIQAETRNAAIVAQLAKTKSRSSQFESLKAQNEKLSAGRAQKLTENEQLAAQITALQTKQNRLVEIQKDTDAQIADLSAQRDQQAKSHQETRQQVESLEVENEKLRGDNKQRYELDEQLSHSQQKVSELAAQNAELRASLSKSKQHHAALIIELENQLSGTHKKLVEQQENESAINRELGMVKLTLLENQGKLKELKQQFGELVTQKAELRKQLVHITNELQEQTHLYHENKKWVISLKKQKEQLTVDLESKSRGADLGQKMLSKSHVDLDFLRKSYSEKVHSEEKLVELVKELKVKLTLASQFYFQLQNEHPELLTSLDNVESK